MNALIIGLGKKMTLLQYAIIANMGEAALTSHMKGKKHIERSPSDQRIKSLIPPTPATTPAITPGNVSDCSNEAGQQKPIDKMLINASTLEAEIRWVLNIIYSKYSMNSSTDSGKLFSAMFPDSDIAPMWSDQSRLCCNI